MVRRVFLFGVVLGTGLVLAAPGGARAQDNGSQQSGSQNQSQSPSGDQQKNQKKSTSQANPFPEEKSEAAAKQAQQQNEAPAASTPNGKTADQNPFPERESEKAAHQDQPNAAPGGAGKPDFSSSQVKGMDLPGTDTAAPAGSPSALGFDPKLAKKDTQVGMFYLQSGDFRGAYDRFAEATKSDPGNAEAVYGLGESALRLGKNDVAVRNFRLYLSALPEGPHAKDVRKAMKKMGAAPSA
ncbi:MAG TPA: tetratricopeptide repeat protein [Acidobacteriaceae bacterium]|jgi:TolA-binding protein|nr:tetratricopeptide repeat protein [Acidobacteriaceae bacterium]